MDKIKLRVKIFTFLLSFCAILLLILWLFETVFLNDMYKLVRRQEIKAAMVQVEKSIETPEYEEVLKLLEDEKEILVMPAKEFIMPKENKVNEKEKKRPETITETKEFLLANNERISLTFHAMITPVNATISTLRLQLIVITFMMLLVAIIIAGILSKRIAKPIVEINKSAKKLSKGQYDISFEGRGFLEIKELSDTLNKTAAELGKTEQFRKELLANISHDLKTPLALIYSYAEMMQDFPEEISAEQTKVIMEESKRLTSLVNDAMDISKLESNTMELHKGEYNLTETMKDVIDRLQELLRNDGYEISFFYDADIIVCADEVKITQVFYNLLLNAIHYCGEKKQIKVTQMIKENEIIVSISDDGEGILEKDLPYIWERYYKADKKHKRAVTGTGLGLSIVKRIIELHDGKYGVESKLGEGSTFWFSLKKGGNADV